MNSQDCGNQAKKDCAHRRCRTCCRSRGFGCPTHVKSTWIPAEKRRHDHQHLLLNCNFDTNTKRLRNPSSFSAPLPFNTAAEAGFDAGIFPAEVVAPAVFRCVRVTSPDNGEVNLAYKTSLNVEGHVCKGILYYDGVALESTTAAVAGGINNR